MAKSLRAKSHLKAKSVKRNAEFQKVVDERGKRISEKLQQDLINQKVKQLKEQDPTKDAMEIEEISNDNIEKEGEPVKVSTSGWRDARHHNYKRNKKLRKTKKKGSFTKF
ncbi:hypothetical protein KAFR_0H01200 [Kazachstania africana CBS 2517]|uniref:DUF2423 domain-containing protein n=1 Tax=Kazachstania africana (strain ATCC 22294 / BCRC 22015 / CBS 2517 / CECT 1963 / NBRC 1671 / NRRL Y-8276) TaxID=1071382 RepID=H2AYX4_KAZAF|nr:hypothetical protein KAFR_0H01200 [Kazachstania africana CBS 2517]CCF59530.1 hypothetical protein KAFR_0H01200 [Kazachstania africana CBS 2517]